jgi:hypothetical protein
LTGTPPALRFGSIRTSKTTTVFIPVGREKGGKFNLQVVSK